MVFVEMMYCNKIYNKKPGAEELLIHAKTSEETDIKKEERVAFATSKHDASKSVLFAHSSLRFRTRQLTGDIDVVLSYLLPQRCLWTADDLILTSGESMQCEENVIIPSHLLSVGKFSGKSALLTRFGNKE